MGKTLKTIIGFKHTSRSMSYDATQTRYVQLPIVKF